MVLGIVLRIVGHCRKEFQEPHTLLGSICGSVAEEALSSNKTLLCCLGRVDELESKP